MTMGLFYIREKKKKQKNEDTVKSNIQNFLSAAVKLLENKTRLKKKKKKKKNCYYDRTGNYSMFH